MSYIATHRSMWRSRLGSATAIVRPGRVGEYEFPVMPAL